MNQGMVTQLFIALTVGLIIGLERDWKTRESPSHEGNAGIRSFSLVGLLGAISALLSQSWGWGVLVGSLVGLSGLLGVSYFLTAQKSQDYGNTTELALLMTFSLGSLVVSGYPLEAIAVAVVVAWLLDLKKEVKHYVRYLQQQELVATLKLLLIAVVILPLLPNQNMGPWDAINPRTTGLFICLVAVISYVGYFAIHVLGDRQGLLVTGIVGGIASSTAVTVSFSRLAKEAASVGLIAAGIGLANGIMAPRILFIIAVINHDLAVRLAIPILLLGLVPLLGAIVIARQMKNGRSVSGLKVTNPLELGTALKYGLLLMIILVMVRAAEHWFGDTGVYLVSAISGVADVDAVSISLAKAAHGSLALNTASIGVLIAVFMNTLVKISLTWFIGGKRLAQWCSGLLLTAMALSLLSAILLMKGG